MALSGLQIYKLLPQTNCKECNFPTCLAFAMKLAAKQAELASCPYVSDTAKTQFEGSGAANPAGDAEQQRPQGRGRQRDRPLPP